ncbi:uncharacterized protein SCDLUD_005256 [Saccharomycodes ludwigii]|uniref:uncharacterized protein n=1 Tax=Saccharomycodes ludwigii TaxID=36035 RepID=UPI001E881965|nr:hypothetical protein SCDLUD_005256 [Saccharomycodes ludwigii]KAH3898912.1 hypothetical protein SCDLUD_005256 [Saccharomycodes ludwigii]
MVQARLKLNKNKKSNRTTKRDHHNKSGLRKAAPLKLKPKSTKAGLHLHKLASKYSLTQATEKLVSAKVGHLELLKGTRKELEKKNKK